MTTREIPSRPPAAATPAGGPAAALAATLAGAFLLLLGGCTPAPTANKLPEFPEYQPNEAFLQLQEQLKVRAETIRRRNEIEVRLNIIQGQNRFYRDWAPLYERVRSGSRRPRR